MRVGLSNLIVKCGTRFIAAPNDRPCGALPLVNQKDWLADDGAVINSIGGDGMIWRVTKGTVDRWVNGDVYPGNEARRINFRARCSTTGGLPGNLDTYQCLLTETPYGLVGENNVKVAIDFYVPDASSQLPNFGRDEIWLFARADTRPGSVDRCSIVAVVDPESGGNGKFTIRVYRAVSGAPFWSIISTTNDVLLLPNEEYTLTLQLCGGMIAVFLDSNLVFMGEEPALTNGSMPKQFKGVGFGFGGNINNLSQYGTPDAGVTAFYLFT